MSTVAPRRVAWHATPTDDVAPRDRIIQAASRSMTKFGIDRTSISSIAREAGVSRQTVYSYFPNREAILREAVPRIASDLIKRIKDHALKSETAADYVVEIVARTVEELLASPAVAPMIERLDAPDGREQAMGEEIVLISRTLLDPVLERQPELSEHADEMAETSLRMTISLLTYPSSRTSTPHGLRDYLRRTLVPALGVRPDA